MAEPKLLQDRTVIVTGAATGIGQAFALASCAHGANVVVADIGPADETVQLVRGRPVARRCTCRRTSATLLPSIAWRSRRSTASAASTG